MNCIKTGAVCHMAQWNKNVLGDMFEVADTYVFRFYPNHWNIDVPNPVNYEIYVPVTDAFLREDLGILVVPKHAVLKVGE